MVSWGGQGRGQPWRDASTAETRGEEAQGQVAVVLREVGEEARVEKVARVARAAR